MISTIIIFIAVLGILVFVHELGHFLVAKKSGMKVDEFGFGFPPRVFGVQKINSSFKFIYGNQQPIDSNNTVYSINWIPLGGFVKIVGENNEEKDNPQSFVNKPFFPRLLTLLAGVIMNFLTAWVLISICYTVGMPIATDDLGLLPKTAIVTNQQVLISEVEPNSPAESGGVKPGDIIVRVDSIPLTEIGDLQEHVRSRLGQKIHFDLLRISENVSLDVVARSEVKDGQGPTGIALIYSAEVKYPFYIAPIEGLKTAVFQLKNIASGLGRLISSGDGYKNLGGPVKIAQLTGQVADAGFIRLMQFAAFLSLNLAVLNTVPFPALDGGRVLFLIVEKIRGKKNNQTFEQVANVVGFIVLLTLMLVITLKDVNDLVGFSSIIGKVFGN
jgi:regulator of sigma E protease